MLYVCVGCVMDVVFSVCIVKHGAIGSVTVVLPRQPNDQQCFSASTY